MYIIKYWKQVDTISINKILMYNFYLFVLNRAVCFSL